MNKTCVSITILLLLLISTVATALPVLADDWSMFRHDPQHTGYIQSSAPDQIHVLWNVTSSPVNTSSPAFGYGRLYIGSEEGYLVCFDADPSEGTHEGEVDPPYANFDFIWAYETQGVIRSSPAFYDGKVYFGSDDGKIYCIYGCIGTQIWSYSTGAPVRSSPTIYDKKVFFGSENGKVYCFDAKNGNHTWEHLTGGSIQSSPAVVNGQVYIGSDDQKLYCLYASNGTEKWNYSFDGMISSSPTVVNGRVYVGSQDGAVFCLNASNGSKYWAYQTNDHVFSSPAVHDNNVYIGSNDGNVYCIYASNGTMRWLYHTNGMVVSSPAIANGKIYVGSMDSYVYCLDSFNGSLMWKYSMGAPVSSSPGIWDLRLFVAAENGNISCIRNHNPPFVPENPWGPNAGIIGETYKYRAKTSDPENDLVYFMFDWGDGNQSEWIGPIDDIRELVNSTHKWEREGSYDVTVKAKDHYGYESNWSEPRTVNIMILSIENIKGGLGLHADIVNIGKRKVWGITWNITFFGGRVRNPINEYFDGDIDQLAAKETMNIRTGPFFELGKVKITISVRDQNKENLYQTSMNGFFFGYVLFLVTW